MNTKIVGLRIREFRRLKHFTRRNLADKTCIPIVELGLMERNETSISPEQLEIIAAALDVAESRLINPNSGPFQTSIIKYEVDLGPATTVFHVTLEGDKGVWEETFSSGEHLNAFLQGVKAGSSMVGGLPVSFVGIEIQKKVLLPKHDYEYEESDI